MFAVADRGWVGWKNEKREFVEIIFEFETIQEFHSIELFCNNQFTRDISIFKELKAFFSIGGDIYNSDGVSYTPMTDEIFEEPRNVTAKLHRRVGRFVKIQLYFASKWLLISEVTFDSSTARGNYSLEVKEGKLKEVNSQKETKTVGTVIKDTPEAVDVPVRNPGGDEAGSHMPIIVGALATVIILLAAIIFFIVSKTRSRKLSSADRAGDRAGLGPVLPSEKMSLNCADTLQFSSYDPLTTIGAGSDSGNSNSNRSGGSRKVPYLENNNFNSSQLPYGSPRSPRTQGSRQGSVHASPIIKRSTPHSTPRIHGTPRRHIINNPMASEGPLYMEPYQVMRYSPYVQYGTSAMTSGRETAILSDASFGDYAIPLQQPGQPGSVEQRLLPPGPRYSDSDTSLDQCSDYTDIFSQVSMAHNSSVTLCIPNLSHFITK